MAKKKSNEESKSYVEFNFKAGDYDFTGRLYKELSKEAGKVTITPVSLTIDDLMSIKGCSLKETKNNVWLSFPEYKNKNGDYVSYVFVSKEQSAFEDLAEHLASL